MYRRITRSQIRKSFEETFEVEESDNDHGSDSEDDEYFPPSEAAASDCDDAGN